MQNSNLMSGFVVNVLIFRVYIAFFKLENGHFFSVGFMRNIGCLSDISLISLKNEKK